jgi:RsiW-degrading membrane proteinase PrsW (M82 family)
MLYCVFGVLIPVLVSLCVVYYESVQQDAKIQLNLFLK